MKYGPIQVAMAPFGLRFDRNEITCVDEHVYIHPGIVLWHALFDNGPKNIKSGFGTGFVFFFV